MYFSYGPPVFTILGDHPSSCQNDPESLYLGQSGHLAAPAERSAKSSVPAGFLTVQEEWDGLCSYAADKGSVPGSAFCNTPATGATWQTARPAYRETASGSSPRALLTPRVNPGSRYRCGRST